MKPALGLGFSLHGTMGTLVPWGSFPITRACEHRMGTVPKQGSEHIPMAENPTGVWGHPHLPLVGAVGLGAGDAAVLLDPLIGSPLLTPITRVVPKAPGAVNEDLLGQWGQHSCLWGDTL